MKSVSIAALLFLMSFQLMASGTISINGKEVKSQASLHAMLAKELSFPSFYAKNLESLYDVLSTDFNGQTTIKIKSMSILKSKLGSEYVDHMVQNIMDASEDNPKVILLIE